MREPYGALVRLLALTGLRIGEALALRRRSVDVLGARLHVRENLTMVNGVIAFEDTKTHQARMVALPPDAVEMLVAYMKDHVPADPDELLFAAPGGGPLRHGNFLNRFWLPAVEKAGLPRITPHNLRDSHASWLVDAGWSIMDVAARLGHESSTVTAKHYARAVPGRDLDLAASLTGLLASGHGVRGSGTQRARRRRARPTTRRQ
jgi:integrase